MPNDTEKEFRVDATGGKNMNVGGDSSRNITAQRANKVKKD
jgi:hypothetical protein